jgi:hypothetical protein
MLPGFPSKLQTKWTAYEGYMFEPCDKDKRGEGWCLTEIEAQLNQLDNALSPNPGSPCTYPAIFILLGGSTIDVSLRWYTSLRAGNEKVYLSEWSFHSHVKCRSRSAEDVNDPCRRVWDIQIINDYRCLAELGVCTNEREPTGSVGTTPSSDRRGVLNLSLCLQEDFRDGDSEKETVMRLSARIDSLSTHISALERLVRDLQDTLTSAGFLSQQASAPYGGPFLPGHQTGEFL